LFSGQNNNQQETEFTEEELKQLQELLNSQSGTISSS
jgi:hypothetical protein